MNLRPWKVIVSVFYLSLAVFIPGFTSEKKQEGQPKPVRELVNDERIGREVVKGQLLIALHDGIKKEELTPIFERMDAKFKIVGQIESLNHFILATDHERLPELRQRLANHPYVASAAYNVVMKVRQAGPGLKKPAFNDPVFKKPDDMLEDRDNWNLHRIKAPEAWEITKGGALIAIVDSGVKLEHEELVGRTISPWTFARDPGAQAGMKKLRAADGTVSDGEVRDHGTHVAITAAGKANNAVGTAGVAPDSMIMPIQVLYYRPGPGNDGTGAVQSDGNETIAGLEKAINSGASVVNMSLGTNLPQATIDRWRNAPTAQTRLDIEREIMPMVQEEVRSYGRVLDLADRRGVIVVVSAMNQNMPAHLYALSLSGRVISVAATTREDKRAVFSNYGQFTTVSAPGDLIYSGLAQPDKAYDYMSGTSMAAPHVTGVVALMKTLDPELKFADVVDILVKTGRPLATDVPIGPLVNAKAALEETKKRRDTRVPRQPAPPPLISPPQNPTLPNLPPNAINILTQPDPWNNPDVQRIIQVWFSFAIVAPPAGGDPKGVWIYNRFGQVVNIRTTITMQQPIWFEFRYRWFWENSMTIESTNMGSLYEFVVGTLRQGRFASAPPRVPENFRPRPNDPRPRVGGLPFNPNLGGTRWSGRNGKAETLEFEFGTNVVTIKRPKSTVRYTVRINTTLRPATIDLYPEGGGAPILGIVDLVGIGELLVRTDFNNKRPTTISRGDPFTFVLKRVDVTITEPGATDDGVQMPILHRGTESLPMTYLIKTLPKGSQPPIWSLPVGFQLLNYALSRDGQRVWVMLYDGIPSVSAGKNFQLWSMRIDGSDAKQATFALDLKVYQAPTVLTNRDGSIAWLFARRPIPFQDPWHIQLQQVTTGGTAKVVLESKDHKGITNGLEPRVTDDGQSLLFIANEGIVRVKNDGSVHVDQRTKDIVYGDFSLPDPRERLSNLAINADGSHWAATATFRHYKKAFQNAKVPIAVVIGSPKGYQLHVEDLKRPLADRLVDSLDMSADGKTVLIGRRNYSLLVWRDGYVKPVQPDFASVYNGVLAGDGDSFYAISQYGGSTASTMSGLVQHLNTGRRRMAISGILGGLHYLGRNVQISQDGTVVTSLSSGLLDGPRGLYVSRANGAPAADFPQIKSIRQRYDGGKLVVTVEASAEGPHRIFAVPLKNGYINPARLIPSAQNPLLGMSGLPDGHNVVPLPKRPGYFQTTVDLGDKHALLDHTYSIRIVVVNAGRNRATYQDVAVSR